MPHCDRSEAMQNQQKLSDIYHQKLVAIIDKQLSEQFGTNACQIDQLTIDLGKIAWSDLEKTFEKQLRKSLASVSVKQSKEKAEVAQKPQQSPLKILDHFLRKGVLPWWVKDRSLSFLSQQLDTLLDKSDYYFKALISNLRYQPSYLDRFLSTFTEAQVLRSLQLLAGFEVKELVHVVKEELDERLKKAKASNSPKTPDQALWVSAFSLIHSAKDPAILRERILKESLQQLGIASKEVTHWIANENTHGEVQSIRQLAKKLQSQQKNNPLWQHFFQYFSKIAHQSALNLMEPSILQALQKQLVVLTKAKEDPANFLDQKTTLKQEELLLAVDKLREQPIDNATKTLIGQVLRYVGSKGVDAKHLSTLNALVHQLTNHSSAHSVHLLVDQLHDWLEWQQVRVERLRVATESLLQPLAKQLHAVSSKIGQHVTQQPSHTGTYEEADFISVDNAGLVILWPFLMRFFENLKLITDRAFVDDESRNKAICVLHYLVDGQEDTFFEGNTPLIKILCGVEIEASIHPVPLTKEDKDLAIGLLEAVIDKGPYWKNLSIEGLRSSYLRREALLKNRDGHWLLQVKKETFDVTLERLPWSYGTVKLPWMNSVLMVEWK